MDPNTTEEPGEATVAFELALEQLVLESFSEGVPVEDSWDITVPVDDAPDWTVTIEKTDSGEPSPDRPGLLEE